jgi:autoinducer 2 (AI-2) kinase
VPADSVFVIDAGTSALRAVRVSPGGDVATIAARHWHHFVPDDGSSFARELRADDVRAAFESLLAEAAASDGRVAAAAVTGQREGVAFLDAAGEPLLISPNIDGRASSEGMVIDQAHGDALYALSGHLPALMHASAKLAWMRAQRPRDAERVRTVLPLVDWLASMLTGEPRISRSLATEIGLADLTTGEVAGDLLAMLGVSRDFVPALVPDGARAGCVRAGPLAGLPVALAGADTQCALVGMGCRDAGTGIAAGWSAPVQTVTLAPIFDARKRTWTGSHVAPDRWVLESNAGECGRAWDWLLQMMSLSQEDADRLAAGSPPGARDAMAVMGPPEMSAISMTIGIGALTFPLPLVMSMPGRGDVLRSALEATAYAIRANLEQLDEIADVQGARIALGGGMSRSRVFPRILCDVIGLPLDVASAPETSALGAAIVVSPALGLHDTIEHAAKAMTGGRNILEPNAKVSAAYDDYYHRWQDMTRTLEQGMT